MKNLKMICFDMDGTVADLYGVDNWLYMLRNEIPTPYEVAKPMWDMVRLAELLHMAQSMGIEIRIITWLSMDSSELYKAQVREAKREWLDKMGFPYDHFHGVAYGTTKADCVRQYLGENEQAILFDDSDKVRAGWHMGEAVNPTEVDIIEYLEKLVEEKFTY